MVQSKPTPYTQEFAAVVVNVAVGAPLFALPLPTEPIPAAFENDSTTSSTLAARLKLAVTAAELSVPAARADQTSAVPGCAFVRWSSVQVNPAPLTVAVCTLVPGSSPATYATSRSPIAVVETDAVALPVDENEVVFVSSCGPPDWLDPDVVKVASGDDELPLASPLTT